MNAGMEQHSGARRDGMKGLVMKTAAALALAMFCLVTAPPALRAEDIVTEPILTFTGHTGSVYSVAYSPDSTKVLTGSFDHTARLWDAATGAHLRTFAHTAGVYSVAFSPDGTKVLTGAHTPDNTARLWNAATGALIRTFGGEMRYVLSVAFSPDGTKVLTGSADATARLWDAATGSLLRTFGDPTTVLSVAYSPDGTKVLTGSADATARLWDAATGAVTRAFSGHTRAVYSVAFSPDGKCVLTGSQDNTARLWDAATGAHIRTFSGHTGYVYSVAFSPNGTKVLTGSDDFTARLWDAATGAPVRTFWGHGNMSVNSVAFSPDGTKVLTGSSDGTARLWGGGFELLVCSSPITGVSITGGAPGVTEFSHTYYQAGQSVTLIAPAVALSGAVRYDFIRWEIDGQSPARRPAFRAVHRGSLDDSSRGLRNPKTHDRRALRTAIGGHDLGRSRRDHGLQRDGRRPAGHRSLGTTHGHRRRPGIQLREVVARWRA